MALFSWVPIWGSKFVAIVFSFIIHTENHLFVGTWIIGLDPPRKTTKIGTPRKLSHPQYLFIVSPCPPSTRVKKLNIGLYSGLWKASTELVGSVSDTMVGFSAFLHLSVTSRAIVTQGRSSMLWNTYNNPKYYIHWWGRYQIKMVGFSAILHLSVTSKAIVTQGRSSMLWNTYNSPKYYTHWLGWYWIQWSGSLPFYTYLWPPGLSWHRAGLVCCGTPTNTWPPFNIAIQPSECFPSLFQNARSYWLSI